MVVDFVVPMVFPEDKKWQYDLQVARGIMCDTRDAVTNVRYRTWDTEELLVRCVRRFMPWVRDIIILLARPTQVQPWMKQEGVRIVMHREFIPKKKLPTFNSMGFEVFLNSIPGLSETFLYGNDDMFPVSELAVTDFFREVNGEIWPCQHHRETAYPDKPGLFNMVCMNALNFVAEEFGKRFDKTWLRGGHSIAPMLKSTCDHLWERDAKRMMDSATTFRDTQNFIQYLYPFWHHLSGKYVDHVPPRCYVSTKDSIERVREAIRQSEGIVCVNDNEAAADIEKYAEAVREEIGLKLKG